jgi:dTDP-4-dehydrorhamnose reductase
MIMLGKEKETLGVVFDQIGTPTYAADLAQAIFTVIECPMWHPGIYHFTNEGVCSWFDFTVAIPALADIKTCQVRPIISEEYAYKTPRPHYSVLDKTLVQKTFGISIPHWYESLKKCIAQINGN